MDKMSIYNASPLMIQNLFCSAEGLRVRNRKYGRLQRRYLEDFLERGSWSPEQLAEYRDSQLRKMIEYCYAHVPYYRRLFDERKIDWRDIRRLEDLSRLPLMNKQTVREHSAELTADNVPKSSVMRMHTSGTTGTALQFLYTKDAYAQQWAEYERYARSIGIDRTAWAAYFGGRTIVPLTGKEKPPFYRINYPMKEILFSSWHLAPAYFPSYMEGMERFKPLFWHGYPSSIEGFARYLLETGKRLSFKPEIIFLTSENLTEITKKRIFDAFGTVPIEGYAQTEQVATFREYPNDGMYVVEDLSAVELLPDPSGLYRVVGTSLTNYAMPFLRYDTGDLVDYVQTPKGRRITALDGRAEDNIKVRDGGFIRRLDFLFKDQIHIQEAQIIQKNLDIVEIRVVKGMKYTPEDEAALKKDVEKLFNGRIGYEIRYVDRIPRGKNGKRKFIVSEV